MGSVNKFIRYLFEMQIRHSYYFVNHFIFLRIESLNQKLLMGQMDHIGKNIKLLRQKHNWNQSQVAKQLKISTPAFSKIETGITDVNYSRLDQIAKIFEVPVTALLAHDKDNLQSKRQEELDTLTTKLNKREEEIIKLQSLLIELYEEVRKK